jgi:hypothetical protein
MDEMVVLKVAEPQHVGLLKILTALFSAPFISTLHKRAARKLNRSTRGYTLYSETTLALYIMWSK